MRKSIVICACGFVRKVDKENFNKIGEEEMRMRKRIFYSNNGVSLIEVVVALGLFSILSLALAQIISNFNIDIKKSENKFAELSLANQLAHIISDKTLCKKAIENVGVPQVYQNNPLLDLKFTLPTGQVIAKNVKYANELLIKEFYVKDLQPPILVGSGLMKTLGNLYLKTEDLNTKFIPRKEKNIGTLQLVFNSVNKEIVECFGSSSDPKVSCENLGFIWNTTKKICQQDPSKACADLGGTWNGCKVGETHQYSTLQDFEKNQLYHADTLVSAGVRLSLLHRHHP